MANTLGELVKLITDTVYENTGQNITGNILQATAIDAVSLLPQTRPVIQNIGIAGASAVGTFTNGSNLVTGNVSTAYLSTEYNALDMNGGAYVLDAGAWYRVNVAVTDNQTAQITEHWNLSADPEKTTDLGANWTGSNLTAPLWAFANVLPADMSNSIVSGFGNVFTSVTPGSNSNNIIIGERNTMNAVAGSNNVIISQDCTAKNGEVFTVVGGTQNMAEGSNPKIIFSTLCATGPNTQYCTVFSSNGASVTEGQNVVAIGLAAGDNMNIVGLTDTVVLKKLMLYDPVPEYADNAAAITAGLVVGQLYRIGGSVNVVV